MLHCPNIDKGVLVSMIFLGSPADRAGFHPGDDVVQFEGRPVGSIKEIIEIMRDKAGKPLKAVVKRIDDRSMTLTVVPQEANPDIQVTVILQAKNNNSSPPPSEVLQSYDVFY